MNAVTKHKYAIAANLIVLDLLEAKLRPTLRRWTISILMVGVPLCLSGCNLLTTERLSALGITDEADLIELKGTKKKKGKKIDDPDFMACNPSSTAKQH